MASLYKRGTHFWIAYRLDGRRVQRSLRTNNERIARDQKRKIEYELAVGDLQLASKLPLSTISVDGHTPGLEYQKRHRGDTNAPTTGHAAQHNRGNDYLGGQDSARRPVGYHLAWSLTTWNGQGSVGQADPPSNPRVHPSGYPQPEQAMLAQ